MKTILVVDDEYAIADILVDVLGDEGYRVLSAANGKEGLARLEAESQVDLLILDAMMPVLDGKSTLQRLRADARYQALPVLLMSAAASIADELAALPDCKVSAFLHKPFALDRLLSLVQQLIGPGEPSRPA